MARMHGGHALLHGKRSLDWYELRRAGRGCGEVGVELQLLPMPARPANPNPDPNPNPNPDPNPN